jgi:hypothetical protein
MQGACCLKGVCSEVLPAACPRPGEVDLANGCATTVTTCGGSPINPVGKHACRAELLLISASKVYM